MTKQQAYSLYPQVPTELVLSRHKLRRELADEGTEKLERYKDKVKAAWRKKLGFAMIGANHLDDELRLAMIGGVKPADLVERMAKAFCLKGVQ